MQYISTRGGAPVGIETAIMSGTAPDGGLYVPISLPATQPADFAGRETLPDIAEQLLMPFFAGSTLAGRLGDICRQALDFPVPLAPVTPTRWPGCTLKLALLKSSLPPRLRLS